MRSDAFSCGLHAVMRAPCLRRRLGRTRSADTQCFRGSSLRICFFPAHDVVEAGRGDLFVYGAFYRKSFHAHGRRDDRLEFVVDYVAAFESLAEEASTMDC